ncbi:MAG: DUF3820 family protein [Bacteroidales bacterium]|nr:DUF3820 family protein [Bacteroidales bacterium]MBN2821298.1 DUF3820 family protein [Bacteroidales bacterium]
MNDLFDNTILIDLVTKKMPYGKYKDYKFCDIPVYYLEWFKRQNGFPKGRLGILLETIFEIKTNGLEYLLNPLKNK